MDTNPKDLIGLTKPPLRLVPPTFILHVSQAMQEGADKYGAYNWRTKKVYYSIYLEAAMRHILAMEDGEDIDPSGCHHAAHAAACMAVLLDAKESGNLIDDRPTPGSAAQLIRAMTKKDDLKSPNPIGFRPIPTCNIPTVSIHTCYPGHDCPNSACEWCGHALKDHPKELETV